MERTLQKYDLPHIGTDKEIDIRELGNLLDFAINRKITWIINCAAYNAVDNSEEEPNLAFAVNAEGVRNIACAARKINVPAIHISTDYVFNGDKDGSYREDDIPDPKSVYGKSKHQGEIYLQDEWPKHFILRISWLFGLRGENFVKTMLKLLNEKDEVRVVDDQWGSPTFTEDCADFIAFLIQSGSESYGIYHFSNEGKTTWCRFAEEIYKKAKNCNLIQREVRIIPVSAKGMAFKAMRPGNSYMSKDKIVKTFGVRIKNWQDALDRYFASLIKN